MVTGDVATAHAGFADVIVTGIPGAGAASAMPPLRNSTVTALGKTGFSDVLDCTMLSAAVVAALETSGAQPADVALMVAVPGNTPETVPFCSCEPAAKFTVDVTTPTRDASVVVSVTVTPPPGAGTAS